MFRSVLVMISPDDVDFRDEAIPHLFVPVLLEKCLGSLSPSG
jgi:hypothetical protein